MNLTTLETRRLRGDLIKVFKLGIGFDKVDSLETLFCFDSIKSNCYQLQLHCLKMKAPFDSYQDLKEMKLRELFFCSVELLWG